MAETAEFTDANFEQEVLQATIPVVVDFWATWCGPCHLVSPIVEEIGDDYAGRVKVGKVNVDGNQATAARFSIRSIPTLLFFKDGAVVEQLIGAVPKEEIQKIIDRLL